MSLSFGLIPFPTSFRPDTITVCAAPTGEDDDGVPITTPGDAGDPIKCAVNETTTTGQATAYEPGPAPDGRVRYEIHCAADPGVTEALQLILWTANRFGAIDPPVNLVSEGPARRPQGLSANWVVSATLRE